MSRQHSREALEPEEPAVIFPDTLTLLHNPRCSKSREARELLVARGIAFHERRYLEEPLTRAELEELARRLGRRVGEWIRRGEAAYREEGLGASSSQAEMLDAMVRRPILIERPILIGRERAVVGRPPQAVLDL